MGFERIVFGLRGTAGGCRPEMDFQSPSFRRPVFVHTDNGVWLTGIQYPGLGACGRLPQIRDLRNPGLDSLRHAARPRRLRRGAPKPVLSTRESVVREFLTRSI